MGNGASGPSADVDAHLRKWEAAINDLSHLCRQQRKVLGGGGSTVVSARATSPASKDGTTGSGAESNNEKGPRDDTQPQGLLGDGPPYGLRRRTSSLVSFGGKDPSAAMAAQQSMEVREFETVHNQIPMSPHRVRPPGGGGAPGPLVSPQISELLSNPPPSSTKQSRARQQELKKARLELFRSYAPPADVNFDRLEGRLESSHFGVVAQGLTFVLGGKFGCDDRRTRVSVEDLFFAGQLPLHCLHSTSMFLSEMYDIVREFLDVDNRFKEKFTVEVVHFDIAPTVGQVEIGSNAVGDRQSKLQLPEFRKQVQADLDDDSRPLRIVYYDPYVLEQSAHTDDADDAGDEDEAIAMTTSITSRQLQGMRKVENARKENNGTFATIVDVWQGVQPMVTLAETCFTDRLYTRLVDHPLQGLYMAMRAVQERTGRSGGYLRVATKKDSNACGKDGASSTGGSASGSGQQHPSGAPSPGGETPSAIPEAADEVGWFFTPELCSGKVLGSLQSGTHAFDVSMTVSPHVIAPAWALHLLAGVRPNAHNYGNGLPVSSIIRETQLPIDVFLRSDLPLDQVYNYLTVYLKRTGLDNAYRCALCPVLTKQARADAAPTLSMYELDSVMLEVKSSNVDPEAPTAIMILQYNANIAHNVLGIAEEPQWGILIGYDEEQQMARIIDANAKRFCTSWTITIDRLHKAITNYGYIVVSRIPRVSKSLTGSVSSLSPRNLDGGDKTPTESVGSLRQITSTVQQHVESLRHQKVVLPVQEVVPTFTFPKVPLQITQVAVALTRIGIATTVEQLVHVLPYDISNLVARNMGLETIGLLTHAYLRRSNSKATLSIRHCDHVGGENTLALSTFVELLTQYVSAPGASESHCVMVHYQKLLLQVFGRETPCGNWGIVTGFDKETRMVTVSDVHANRYYRTWTVDAQALHRAMSVQRSNLRSRGLIVLAKQPAGGATPGSGGVSPATLSGFGGQQSISLPSVGRDFHLFCVPLQNMFNVSPSPQMQGLSAAFAQLDHFYSPEEIFYEAYLKTMTDQRRRGSQAFAWRDVETSLAILNKRVNASIMAQVARKFLESRKVTGVTAELIDDVDPTNELEPLLLEASHPESKHVVLCNYSAAIAHSLEGVANSSALVKNYDPDTRIVTLFEAEFTQYGLWWTCSLDTFIRACDLTNEGKSDYGLVKIALCEGAATVGGGRGFAFVGSPTEPPASAAGFASASQSRRDDAGGEGPRLIGRQLNRPSNADAAQAGAAGPRHSSPRRNMFVDN